jgi:hypothetical protein
MIALTIVIHHKTDPSLWPEIEGRGHVDAGVLAHVAILDEGMESGLPSVMLRLDMPDGTTIIAQQTARQIATLGRLIMAKYPNLLD